MLTVLSFFCFFVFSLIFSFFPAFLLSFYSIFPFVFFPCSGHSGGLLIVPAVTNFTIFSFNHLCLVWVYLPTTTGSSASLSPALDKEKLFYLLAYRGALSCHDVGVFSLYPSWHAPNGSSLNLASFGWSVIPAGRTSQKNLGRSRKIGLFPSPHHQTIPPYLWPMTPPHPILAGYRLGTGWWCLGFTCTFPSCMSKICLPLMRLSRQGGLLARFAAFLRPFMWAIL